MTEPAEPATPRPDRHTHGLLNEIASEYGKPYAAAVDEAAGLRFFLDASADQLDPDNADQLMYRANMLQRLSGMLASAAAMLTGDHHQPGPAARQIAEIHIASLAATKEADAKNAYELG